jgi:hypothetical protein
MAMTPEGRVKERVKAVLKLRGAYYYMPVSNGMGRVGAPDFIVCHDGRFIAIETKAPGKVANTTPNQKRELAAIRAANGLAVVIDDVEQLKEILDA